MPSDPARSVSDLNGSRSETSTVRPRDREILLSTYKQEIDDLRTNAWIFADRDGGPLRTIIDGRHRTPTGRNTFIKSGSKGMPWESSRAEEPLMRFSEVATPVHSYLAQPHRLEMAVSGLDRHLIYFPDAQLTVDRAFAMSLMKKGARFDEAVRKFRPEESTGDVVTLIVEAKTTKDKRQYDPLYRAKLTLAKQVYLGVGWYFYELLDTWDLANLALRAAVNDLYHARYTALEPADIDLTLRLVRAGRLTLGQLLGALGGNDPIAKVMALHIRRVISLNLSNFPTPQAHVRLVDDRRHILDGVM